MKERIRNWILPWLVSTATVPTNRCVHYCGFRYGRNEFNPYENYVDALARGEALEKARERFVDFLRYYRPAHFGEALGVKLSRKYALWFYPWFPKPRDRTAAPSGWMDSPDEVPDILTHFSARGISWARIQEEFSWLGRAFSSIRESGYHPELFSGHIEARKLVASDGGAMFLITDGNHRLSALTALGHTSVVVKHRRRMTVRERGLTHWPQVKTGHYSEADARSVFRAYFGGNTQPRTVAVPAPILETDSLRA